MTAAAVGGGVFGSPAQAEDFHYCAEPAGVECGTISVCTRSEEEPPLSEHTWCKDHDTPGGGGSDEDYLIRYCVTDQRAAGTEVCVAIR